MSNTKKGETPVANNWGNTVIEVRHSELEREGDSVFRSKCPVCDNGILPVYRDAHTLQLRAEDVCVWCGQPFVYLDIDEMREKYG